MPSATLIGTPAEWYMSACMDMTFGNRTLEDPSGWCPTRASMRLPFSLSLSARRTSPVPMSMPHMNVSASMSRASSEPQEKRQSSYGFHRRSGSNSSFSFSSADSYSLRAASNISRISLSGRGSSDMPSLMAIS